MGYFCDTCGCEWNPEFSGRRCPCGCDESEPYDIYANVPQFNPSQGNSDVHYASRVWHAKVPMDLTSALNYNYIPDYHIACQRSMSVRKTVLSYTKDPYRVTCKYCYDMEARKRI